MLSLNALGRFAPNFEYHHQVQAFIYSLLRNTTFEDLHDKKGYKFFCFSNIFRGKDATDELLYNLIVSSPSPKFIDQISYQLQKIIELQIPVEIGCLFQLRGFNTISTSNLTFPLRLITGSPILIRVPLEKFSQESTDSAPYQSIYWRSHHPIHLFIDALESNLKKKYKDFRNNKQIDYEKRKQKLIEKFYFKKQVSTNIHIDNSRIPVIGSLWEFVFSETLDKEIQLFALDCGFGERNSLGFGFMNPVFSKTD